MVVVMHVIVQVLIGNSEFHEFQCESNEERDKWIANFRSFSREYASEADNKGGAISVVHENEFNKFCADCGSTSTLYYD